MFLYKSNQHLNEDQKRFHILVLIKMYLQKNTEFLAWTLAFVFLFFMDVSTNSKSLCVFKMIGFKSCFGCGIGHSIHSVLHLNFKQSLQEHILGIPTTIFIVYKNIKYFSAKTN